MDSAHLLVAILLLAGGINAHDTLSANLSGAAHESDITGRLLTPEEGCGFTLVGSNKIVGGTKAKAGAFPWMALLGYNTGASSYKFKCGGSLITSKHVLTAAHCVKNTLKIVRLGEHDLRTKLDGPHQDIKVVRARKHRAYTTMDDRNDITILYLEHDVEFSDRIRPICLPLNEPVRSKSFIGSNPFVAGWGTTKKDRTSSDVLMQVQVPVHENVVCKEAFRKKGWLAHEDQFDSTMLCAGHLAGGKDSCTGDSGGPLMLPQHENGKFPFYQIGVVSYVIGCGEKGTPSAYANVQHFADWIKMELNN